MIPVTTPAIACSCGDCQHDPLRAAIVAGLLFKRTLDAAPLAMQERYDMQDILDMMVAQLKEHRP